MQLRFCVTLLSSIPLNSGFTDQPIWQPTPAVVVGRFEQPENVTLPNNAVLPFRFP
jgi:hypothetical protein